MNEVLTLRPRPSVQPPGGVPPAYAELMTTSNFSFLRSGSHAEELVGRAAALGLSGLGLCDRNSFAGVVRAYVAMRDIKLVYPDFRYVVGTRLVFVDGTPDIIAYPSNRAAYGRLCKLLTTGNLRAEKGDCILYIEDLKQFAEGQLFIFQIDETRFEAGEASLQELMAFAGDRVWLAVNCTYQGQDRLRLNRLADLARRAGVPMLAVNDVLYHDPSRRVLQDVVTCIREHLTIFEAGRRLEKHAERHLKHPAEMARLFREHPQAIAETQKLLSRINFTLDELKYNYPEETIGNGETAQQTLERLAWVGAEKRYPSGIPDKVRTGVTTELALIKEMKYAPYFLTVHDLVRYARDEMHILCQGRGSAANSTVCFCLGVTEVDPMVGNLVFGRFLSTERLEPPDIDVDFEHERREEVMQYLYRKYSRERTGLTATVVTYRSKGAIREVSKVFGLSTDAIDAMNELSWGWYSKKLNADRVKELGFDPNEPTLKKVLEIAGELMGFPRHLSQHVGGFVITRDRLDHLIPIANAAMDERTVVEWDKSDLDALNILKVDVLALGMLSCIRRAFELMHQHYGLDLTLAGVLDEERQDQDRRKRGEPCLSDRVYAMTHRADTVGVFQIESRAQMSMLPRLKPKEFYDLVIEVAIVRPGPIQGGMVHPYLKRRQGIEKAETVSNELHAVLERTLGIPLFQEQAMQIAIVGAGFEPGAADQLRRAMATFRRSGTIHTLKDKFLAGMIANHYEPAFAERCFKQIEGFGDYGFPESHAASFALLVYVSCWLKCHYPDVFACALLNSQPMGFYAPAQIVRDAIEHGVEVLPADINRSDLWNILEDGTPAAERLWERHAEMKGDIRSTKSIRLGLSQITGLKDDHTNLIIARRGTGYDSVRDLWLRTGVAPSVLEKLAEADAFGSLGLNRRDALWAVKGLMGTDGAETLPLFAIAGPRSRREEADADLPPMPPGEAVVHDYKSLSLSLKGHPVSFLRGMLQSRGFVPADDLRNAPVGRLVQTAGLVLVRQRPGTATGVIFATLEDETSIANIIIWPRVFEKNRRVVLGSRLMGVKGELQREGLVVHLIAREFFDFTPPLLALASGHDLGEGALARADEGKNGPYRSDSGGRDEGYRRRREMAERQSRAALPGGRNFH
jgi:error-prone DNA polymerase